MAQITVNDTLDVVSTLIVDSPVVEALNPIDVRIYPEQTPSYTDPHQEAMRGLGITWSNGGSSTRFVYASFVTPHTFSIAEVHGTFKFWPGSSSTYNTHSYSDVVRDGTVLPQIHTPTDLPHQGDAGGYTTNEPIDIVLSAEKGDVILVAFSVDGIQYPLTKLVLHALWLEYVAW